MNPLIGGYEAGFYTLPKELVAASRSEDVLAAALDEQPWGPQMIEAARKQFQAALIEAARAGKKLPTGSEVVQAKLEAAAQVEVVDELREAARLAQRHAAATFADLQPMILEQHLRPAFEDTISKARKASAAELPALEGRYGAIRGARAALHRLPAPARDVHGMFAEYRNLDEWWPSFYPQRRREQVWGSIQHSVREIQERTELGFTPPPWPDDPLVRFGWLIANAEPWLPSPQQQDARFEAYLEKANAERSAAVRRGNLERAVS